jgi:hypothetical protein
MAREPGERYASASDVRAALLATGGDIDLGDDHTVATGTATPDATAAGTVAPRPSFRQTERSWFVPTLLLVTAAVAIGVAGLLLSQSGAGNLFDRVRGAVGGDSTAKPVEAVAAAYDPFGTGGENDDLAAYTVDGDDTTGWRSERYNDRNLTSLKPGVGLILAIDNEADIDRVEVTSPTPGWRGELYVAPKAEADFDAWGEPVARIDEASAGMTKIDAGDTTGAAVLVWFTYVGDGPQSRIDVTEVRVFA